MPRRRPPKPLDFSGNVHPLDCVLEYDRIMLEKPGAKRDELLLEWVEHWGDALLDRYRNIGAPGTPARK